jgi:hypothetical protein
MDTIHINPFRSNKDNRVRTHPTSWDLLVRFILPGPLVVAEKQQAPLFNAVQYKTIDEVPSESSDWAVDYETGESFVKRRKVNILQVDCLVLDYDDGLTIDQAKERFSAYEYVGYSSYNHLVKPGVHKFRLVFRLTSPIPAWVKFDEYERPIAWGDWYYLQETLKAFAGPCDPASLNANQIYYVPSVHPDNRHLAVAWHHQGEPLDWTTFDRVAPNHRPVLSLADTHEQIVRRSDKTLHPNDTLETERGPIRVGDVQGKIEGVLCPFHPDKKGSEFVKRVFKTGNVFLHCRTPDLVA